MIRTIPHSRPILVSLCLACLLLFSAALSPLPAQEQTQETQTKAKPKKKPDSEVVQESPEEVIHRRITVYDPKDSRDPFKDLLGGREPDSKTEADGISQLSVEELMLTGIIKVRGELIAIIKDPQGFPAYIKEGDRFTDGFVLSIEPTRMVLRKLTMRGIPLLKPKDIVKELFSEEQ
jgi:hypothetical protein